MESMAWILVSWIPFYVSTEPYSQHIDPSLAYSMHFLLSLYALVNFDMPTYDAPSREDLLV